MNRLYRVWCRFEPNFKNPLTGRMGQYRVDMCHRTRAFSKPVRYVADEGVVGIISNRRHQEGSIIRPHAELRRVLAARKGAA
jgi:hypothetical protein